MLNFAGQFPQVQVWQSRLSRVPRWAWLLLFIGMVLFVIVTVVIFLAAMIVGGVLRVVAKVVNFVTAPVRRLLHRPMDDGRRNVRIMVHSARVIDP